MILKNWKPTSFPPIPENLKNKLILVSNVILNQRELNLFYLAITWISEQIKKGDKGTVLLSPFISGSFTEYNNKYKQLKAP